MNFLLDLSTWFIYLGGFILSFLVISWLTQKPLNDHYFVNKIVLLTGAAGGLGSCLAYELAKRKAILCLVDINDEILKKKTNEIIENTKNQQVYGYECDITDPVKIHSLIREILMQFPERSIDILINNAAIVNGKRIEDLKEEEIQRTFQTNVFGVFYLVKKILPQMKEKKEGSIVSVCSVMGLGGAAKLSDYCASKFAVAGFQESLRQELLRENYPNIHTLLVCPGAINTGMFEGIGEGDTLRMKLFRFASPMLSPEYVADNIVQAILQRKNFIIIWGSGWRNVLANTWFHIDHLLPISWRDQILAFIGASHGMDNFQGKMKPIVKSY